jgi:hypothetical protein
LSYVGVCVQQCLQALGLLDAEIEVEGP